MISDSWSFPDNFFQLKTIIADFKESYGTKISACEQKGRLLRVEPGLLTVRPYGIKTEEYRPLGFCIDKFLFDKPEFEEEPSKKTKASAFTSNKPCKDPIPDDPPQKEIEQDIPEKKRRYVTVG